MGKDPGSYSHKRLEASKDLGPEKGALPLLAGTQARHLLSLPGATLCLKGRKTKSERTADTKLPAPGSNISPVLRIPGSYLEELTEAQQGGMKLAHGAVRE